MSAGRFLRAQPHRAATAASGLALLSSRLVPLSERGGLELAASGAGLHGARGMGERRGEPRCPPLPSPPAAVRAALTCLTPQCPARSSPARQGLAAAASAPHPLPGQLRDWEGARRKVGGSPLASPEEATASVGPRKLGLLLLSPLTPPPAPLYLRGTRARRRRRADPARRQLSVRSPAGRRVGGGV